MMGQGAGWCLVLAVVAGGCLGASTSSTGSSSGTIVPPAAPPETETDLGSISGHVYDDEQVPIGGATVADLGTRNETTADAVGAFTFNKVAPGEHRLVAQKIGYVQATKRVTVAAGEIAQASLTLKALVIDKEWVQVDRSTAGILSGNYVAVYPNDVQAWTHTWSLKDYPQALKDIYFEASWTPSTQLGDGIRFWSFMNTLDTKESLCIGTGHQPYLCRVAPDKLAQDWGCTDASGCAGAWRIRPGGSSAAADQVGAWPQESVTIYTSLFYRTTMPEGYKARSG